MVFPLLLVLHHMRAACELLDINRVYPQLNYLKLGELVRLQALSSQDPLYHRLGYLHDGPELEEIVTESIHEVQDLVLK